MIAACQKLDQHYGSRQVLFGVEFELLPGCTGLLGPNGAGKSTLIRSLLGQLPLLPGRVSVAGHDPASQPLRVRQKVGYMPEKDIYLPGLNGLELVTFCGQLSGMRRSDAIARAHEVLHFVGLGESRYREVDGYSTGMRQRTKLAAALVHGPLLLLLDEPTTGLDPAGRQEMLEMIAEVSGKRRVNVLLSSHILHDIEQACEQVVVLTEGRVHFAGSLEQFKHDTDRRIQVRVKSGHEAMAAALRAAGFNLVDTGGSSFLEVELTERTPIARIWQIARENNLQIRHLAPATGSLQRAFASAVNDAENRV